MGTGLSLGEHGGSVGQCPGWEQGSDGGRLKDETVERGTGVSAWVLQWEKGRLRAGKP